MRQRHERGLVASGIFASEIYEGQHWDDPTRRTTYADVDWDVLLPVDDRLTVQDLKASLPGVSWDRLQGSGVLVDVASAQVLEDLWAAHAAATPYRAPEDLPPATYTEGAVTRIEVNRYERDRAARAACIAHHGTICAACGFDFEVIYGKLGRDFIHVHHLREISTLGPDYKINPVTELRPLCANCHSMVHRRAQPSRSSNSRRGFGRRRRRLGSQAVARRKRDLHSASRGRPDARPRQAAEAVAGASEA
jgi:5-methylcytosine-specific restriction protein A